ncbi:MAG: hypothetical protein ABJX32_04755 [Tateyamaria sp.]|uniref:hypothetical protein n=1 Tax=Tateyamaria sp. TaxID=1929288 RepID=UPI0032A0D34C
MAFDMQYDTLKSKQREIRGDFSENTGLRVHRALSWLGRAELCGDDYDARFIFLWIAFNAAYADSDTFNDSASSERSVYSAFFTKAVSHDDDHKIYDAIWTKFSGPIRSLMSNRYTFNGFWHHQNGVAGYEDWQDRFASSAKTFARAVQTKDTSLVLSKLFERLYVLRNQIIHGGSTWNSVANRSQVKDGAAILEFLMPIYIDIMMDNPTEDWGKPHYPVIK